MAAGNFFGEASLEQRLREMLDPARAQAEDRRRFQESKSHRQSRGQAGVRSAEVEIRLWISVCVCIAACERARAAARHATGLRAVASRSNAVAASAIFHAPIA